MYAIRRSLVLVFLLFGSATALAQSDSQCEPLKPHEAKDIEDSFKGTIIGKVEGMLSKFAGGKAELIGEYKKIEKDTLKDYPESHQLYAWRAMLYYACVNPSSGIDIGELFKLFFSGPPDDKNAAIEEKIFLECTPDNNLKQTFKINGKTASQRANEFEPPNVEALFRKLYVSTDGYYSRGGDGNFIKAIDVGNEEKEKRRQLFLDSDFVYYPNDLYHFMEYTERMIDIDGNNRLSANSALSRMVSYIDNSGILLGFSETQIFDRGRLKAVLTLSMPVSRCAPYEKEVVAQADDSR